MTNLELLELAKRWRKVIFQGEEISLETALQRFEIGELLFVCDTWAVTHYGVECLVFSYPIERQRINDDTRENWVEHISKKDWANLADFMLAFEMANQYFNLPTKSDRQLSQQINLTIRFKVFRRDNYCCRICGASAADGAKLELDHVEPKSKGGANDLRNYQTLCFECNRGKRNLNL